MNKEALYHVPTTNFLFGCKKNEVKVRFRTKKNDVEKVNIYYGVKFDWINKKHDAMKKIFTDTYFDYYEYKIVQKDLRIGYYFEVIKGDIDLFYTEAGVIDSFDDNKAHRLYFQFPDWHLSDQIRQPSWIKDAVFYQIFVERFRNGNSAISPDNIVPWDSDPNPTSFYGGDLIGIKDNLEYLVKLGFNALYLTPIFKSISNHKYDTTDYFEIDEHFGTKEDFRELVEKAHKLGIRVVLDAVFNHCSENIMQFQDVIKKGEKSKYKDWFMFESLPVVNNPPNYKTFSVVPYMPRFNTENEEVKQFLISVASYWTKEFGVDGWRLDVSDEPSHEFWRDFRKAMKDIDNDIFLVGENWHDASLWLIGDQFDSVMNYPVTGLCLDYFATGDIDTSTFTNRLVNHYLRYCDSTNSMMFNLLDSHDTERFLFMSKEDKRRLLNAASFLFAYVGVPCTYYGTEIGMTGGYDPGCRKGFNWNREEWDKEIFVYYQKLIQIRKNEKALRYGNLDVIINKDLLIFKRTYKEDAIYIVINNTKEDRKVPENILNESSIELISGSEKINPTIKAMSAYYLK